MLRRIVALLTVAALASAGCGGRAWPSTAPAVADPGFASQRGEIATVDVLPLDLAVWTEAGVTTNPAELRARAESRIMNAALAALSRRSYGVAALIDWNGESAGTAVLPRKELLGTVTALAHYGAAVEQQPGALPAPVLPTRLGQTTGSDATLYVGGWAYVPAHHQSTGSKVLEGVAIAIVAVAVVGIVLAILSSDDDSSSSSSKKSSGHHEHRNGGAAIQDHHEDEIVEIRDHRSTLATLPVVHDHRGPTVRDHRDSHDPIVTGDHRSDGAPTFHDHRGDSEPTFHDHRGTHTTRGGHAIDLDLSWMDSGDDPDAELDPTWRAQQPTQGLGKDSQLYLEMTLVDNHTGRVVWHSHQMFPANISKPSDTERAARLVLASLPAR